MNPTNGNENLRYHRRTGGKVEYCMIQLETRSRPSVLCYTVQVWRAKSRLITTITVSGKREYGWLHARNCYWFPYIP
jgi:hypothetical protein